MLNRRFSTRLMRVLGPAAVGAAMIESKRTLAQTPIATPAAASVRDAVVTFSQFEAEGDVYAIARSYHPDSLNEAPGYVVAGWYRDTVFPKGPQIVESTGEVKQVPAWTWPVNGKAYTVSQLPFRQAFDHDEVLEDVATLAFAPEAEAEADGGSFLRFFGEKRQFVETQVKTYYDRLLAGAFQTDIQLLSFPALAIDLASVLPATWEDFTLADTGNIAAVAAGQWARYVHQDGGSAPETAEELQVSWVQMSSSEEEPRAFDYALRAPVRFGDEDVNGDLGLLAEPDVTLLTTTADNTFVQVQAPSAPDAQDRVTDRLVFMVPGNGGVWYHMVQATNTDPNGGLAQRFASSLPYIAV